MLARRFIHEWDRGIMEPPQLMPVLASILRERMEDADCVQAVVERKAVCV